MTKKHKEIGKWVNGIPVGEWKGQIKFPQKFSNGILKKAAEERRLYPHGVKALETQLGLSLEEQLFLHSKGIDPIPKHIPLKPGDIEVTFFRKIPVPEEAIEPVEPAWKTIGALFLLLTFFASVYLLLRFLISRSFLSWSLVFRCLCGYSVVWLSWKWSDRAKTKEQKTIPNKN